MNLGKLAIFSWPWILLLSILVDVEGAHVCDGITGTYEEWFNQALGTKKVIVVGGGISGLEATKTLIAGGISNVLLLEAQDYLGGRVKTHREGSILVEDGAEWINGGNQNPLYGLAKNISGLTQPLADQTYVWAIRTQDGDRGDALGYMAASNVMQICEEDQVLANYQDVGYGNCYIDKFPLVYKNFSGLPAEESAWFHYLHMWVVKDTGTSDWREQSGRDADHFTDWGLDEWNQWAGGFDTLTKHIKSSIPDNKIKLSSPVCKIFWNSGSNRKAVVVTSTQEAYITDFVLVTASVGHLKERHSMLFSPALPTSYSQNFDRINLGVADKVQIGWDKPWWGTNPLDLNVIFTQMNLPEEQSWLYGIMEFMSIHQQVPIIQAFVTGNYSLKMESLTEEKVEEHILAHLQRLNITDAPIPPPTFRRRTKWYDNIWMRGSYNSIIPVEGDKQGLKSRDPFLVPIENNFGKVIFWAGEHTDTYRYGTVDGAMMSGRQTAEEIIEFNKIRP
ncbi:spermine oxidase-like [Palaemon carinicauda]|uniref:spermine oxidase-like n=1 Tax=Palaemon carinicauda TaxID=392227 RepID=UPI0035B65743